MDCMPSRQRVLLALLPGAGTCRAARLERRPLYSPCSLNRCLTFLRMLLRLQARALRKVFIAESVAVIPIEPVCATLELACPASPVVLLRSGTERYDGIRSSILIHFISPYVNRTTLQRFYLHASACSMLFHCRYRLTRRHLGRRLLHRFRCRFWRRGNIGTT